MNVIQIKFSCDLPTKKQNELRYRMELAKWKEEMRKAVAMNDYWRIGELNASFFWLGLP